MNRTLHRFLASLFALALLASGPAQAATKIGVLLKGKTDFWIAVEKGAVDAGRKIGADVVVRMPVSESDIAVQIGMVDAMSREGIQALIIAPCSTTDLAGPVAALAAKGVKIVVIDTPLDGEMPVFIGTNHTDAGAAAGRLLAPLLRGGDEVSILKHSKTAGATTLREVSAYAELRRAHPDLVINRDIFSGTEAGRELEKARQLLAEHPRSRAILASSTPGSMAMLQALQESGRAGSIEFVGFGFNLNPTVASALASGAMRGWIAQLPDEIGGKGVNAAVSLLRGDPVAEVSFCHFLVITKDNLNDPKVQALMGP